MNTPVFITADLHGRLDGLEELLRAGGVLNADGTRNREVMSVQLGDLVNVVREDRAEDCNALDAALDGWFDLVLVGNHEHPFFGGPRFWGYELMSTVADRMEKLAERSMWVPSHYVPELDLLVTHAGWADDLRVSDGGGGWLSPSSAATAHEYLVSAWIDDPTANVFSRIGPARGGHSMARCGGVLWSDWEEVKLQTFNQLVGHTTGDSVRSQRGRRRWAVCIDTNAKRYGRATGALVEPDAGTMKVITGTKVISTWA